MFANNQFFLKLATVVTIGIIFLMLGLTIFKQKDESRQADNDVSTVTETVVPNRELILGHFANKDLAGDETQAATEDVELTEQNSKLMLRVGVIGSTPKRNEVTTINKLPFTDSQVHRAYRDSKGRACRILIPGAPVSPPRSYSPLGSTGTYGRISTMTIGLEMDAAGRSKLPAVVRGQVDKYLRTHRLSVQPTLYHDTKGQLYFGTDCQTAFFDMSRPGITVKAEPMIDVAVSRFRSLGVVGAPDAVSGSAAGIEGEAVLGRTLAMAFQFEKAETQTAFGSSRSRFTTELMLLHLPPDATVDNPSVKLFITSDSRQTLHRLDTLGERLNSPMPTISADVRFDKMILMGLYPADPVVTGIHYRSEGVVSMESLRRMTQDKNSDGETVRAMSVTEILDQFSELSNQSSGFSGERRSVLDQPQSLPDSRGSGSRRTRGFGGKRVLDPTLNEDAVQKPKMMTGFGSKP